MEQDQHNARIGSCLRTILVQKNDRCFNAHQTNRIEAAEREKRMKERQAAKLRRKRQLAELRANAQSRSTGEELRKVERDKEAEERKRWEGEELERMRLEETAQLAGGDR